MSVDTLVVDQYDDSIWLYAFDLWVEVAAN